jgi:hypothetical protein
MQDHVCALPRKFERDFASDAGVGSGHKRFPAR